MPTYSSIPTSQYVKFVRGTPTAFNNLANKDADTLYFIADTNATSGKLYLGSKIISGSTDISSIGDIIISSIGDKHILIYDNTQNAWVNADINSVIGVMSGATASTNGVSGLVPAPLEGDQNKFLKGDGSWASPVIDADLNIFTTNQDSQLTLIDFDSAASGSLLQKNSSGSIDWVDPSTLQTDLTAVESSINDLQSVVSTLLTTKMERQIVNSVEAIDLTKDNVIYMVPTSNGGSGNLYNEYIVINGAAELIGNNYEGDLTGYVTTTQLNQEIGNLNTSISGLDDRLVAVEGDYLTVTKYNAEVGDLTQLTLSQNNGDTLVDQVNDLTDRLTWYLIQEI